MPVKATMTVNTTIVKQFKHMVVHATEANLKLALLYGHVDEDGRESADRNLHVRVMLLQEFYNALEYLTLCLIHALHLSLAELSLLLALVHIGIHYVGGTKEMEDVGMCLGIIAEHIQGILKQRACNLLPPWLSLALQFLLGFRSVVLNRLQFLFLLSHVLAIERRVSYDTLDTVEMPLKMFIIEQTDKQKHSTLNKSTLDSVFVSSI